MRSENYFKPRKKMATPMKKPRLAVGRPKISVSAKKKRKLASQKAIKKSRIFIGDQISRWNDLKTEIGAKTNVEVAKCLLEKYYESGSTVEAGPSKVVFPSKRKFMTPLQSSTPASTYRLPLQRSQQYESSAESTAELEGFNNLILMYAGKRFSYIPPVYRARNLVAAIDHNSHLFRPSVNNKDVSERVHKIFNKESSRWLIRPVKDKKYEYKNALMETVLRMRTEEKKSMFEGVILKADDPRRISSTIAQVAPPSTEQLREQQTSRFKKVSE